uniref:ShKT domain-containing protein n=1 Tax=Globodera rostochiensis TaxID=31243 RepID=A0A914HMC5_GLORO
MILSFGWIFPCILCQYNANPAYSGYAVAAPNAYQQQQPYPTGSNSYPTLAGQYPGAAPYPQNNYPTNVYAGQTQPATNPAYYPSSNPIIPTMFPQYPSIYPQNPQTIYSNPNDPKCPDGWKKDGNCKTTGICVDRKEHCFYGAICCQIDSKIRQKTTKQNPKTGKTETDWCPIYSYKDGTCSGIKFFCADLSEECVKGDCCEKNSNIPSVPTNPTYPGQQPTYPGQTYPGQQPTYPGQTYPGQQPTYPGQTYPGQQPTYPGQTYPGQQPTYPGQTYPGQQPTYPGQSYPGQQPTYPGQTYPGQQPTYPGQTYPGQQATYPGQQPTYPGQTYPGQQPTYPGQTYPGQQATYPGQQPTYPGQTYPGQQATYPGQSQTYPTMAGIDPMLLQQACAIGDEQLCVDSVKNNPAMCSDSSISQTCPKSCGLCNSIAMG